MKSRLICRAIGPLAAAVLAASAVACGSDSTSPPVTSNPLVADTLTAEGGLLAREVLASVTSLTVLGEASFGGIFASDDRAPTYRSIRASLRGSRLRDATLGESGWLYLGCGSVAPSPAGDADDDGIPDSVTLTFVPAQCTFQNDSGTIVGAVSGQTSLVDQNPDSVSFSYTTAISMLKFAFTSGDATFSETRNGTRAMVGDTLTISQTQSIATEFDSASTLQAVTQNHLSLAYVDTSSVGLSMHEPLKSGTISVTGSFDWTRGSTTDEMIVTTVAPLMYSSFCRTNGRSRFKGGELRAAFASPGRKGHVEITWARCGTPIVVYSPT